MGSRGLVQSKLYVSKSANAMWHCGVEEIPKRLWETVVGLAHSRLPTRLAALSLPRLLEPAGLHISALLALQKVLEILKCWGKLT